VWHALTAAIHHCTKKNSERLKAIITPLCKDEIILPGKNIAMCFFEDETSMESLMPSWKNSASF
jgi:hypothetical protein